MSKKKTEEVTDRGRKMKIMFHPCEQPFQDATLGKNRRWFNRGMSGKVGQVRWRCTACGKRLD